MVEVFVCSVLGDGPPLPFWEPDRVFFSSLRHKHKRTAVYLMEICILKKKGEKEKEVVSERLSSLFSFFLTFKSSQAIQSVPLTAKRSTFVVVGGQGTTCDAATPDHPNANTETNI